ncbi:MAG: WcaF family extracellular polysaccharide biosynthesis acetyltransferase [Bacteroidota bacterium]
MTPTASSQTSSTSPVAVDFSVYKNDTFSAGASGPKRILWYLTNAIFFLSPFFISSGLKVFLLRLFGAKVGQGVIIKPRVNIKFPWKLSIGDHTWIGEGVWIDNLEPITIGRSVCLSQGALLLPGSHDHRLVSFDYKSAGIVLEDGVWIAARAMVGKGVVCKSHAILGMNSVAEKDLEPYTIYKGNPAVPVRKREIKPLSTQPTSA